MFRYHFRPHRSAARLSERFSLPGVAGLLVGGIILGPEIIGLLNPKSNMVGLFAELGKLETAQACRKLSTQLRKENIMNQFTDADVAKTGGKKMTTFGVIAIILGMFAMLAPGLTGISIVFLLGVLVLIGGIVRIIWAFQAGSFGKGLLMFAIGGLTLLCGIALLANPLFASGVLTIMLALYFIIDGISEVVAGIKLRPGSGRGWMLFGGIVSIWLGIMIWAQFPLSGVWAIGILLGIKLFFVGLIMVMAGSAVHSMANK